MLMQLRKVHGALTALHWVHSHVDDEDRRKRVKAPQKAGVDWWETAPPKGKLQEDREVTPLACACGGDEHGHCLPMHPHHMGNVLADALADKGKVLDEACMHAEAYDGRQVVLCTGEQQQLLCQQGEDGYVLIGEEGLCQGSIVSELSHWIQHRHLRRLANGRSKRGAAWAEAHSLCWQVARSSAMDAKTSWRYKVRAWADCLPTYANLSQKARGDGPNVYKYVYGDGGAFEGHCLRGCGSA